MTFVFGVDGCRGGWVAARRDRDGGPIALSLHPGIAFLFEAPRAAAAMIDMPIGLADSGRRACEREARARLKPRRQSSVFAAPRRPMLDFSDYAAANAFGKAQGPDAGGGLSKQAWMLISKIREVDAAMTPAHQAWIGECHPEVAFARLNGGPPCRHPKRTPEGAAERLEILRRAGAGDIEAAAQGLRREHARAVALDDSLDACALAFSAEARLDGRAWRLGDGARDARGLLMEIWG